MGLVACFDVNDCEGKERKGKEEGKEEKGKKKKNVCRRTNQTHIHTRERTTHHVRTKREGKNGLSFSLFDDV